MRFFIFPLDGIYIAVAADKVKRFISSGAVPFDSGQIKVPVCVIFGKPDNMEKSASQHGIVLKKETEDNKTLVIITPPVERDIDVEESDIQSLPGSFKGVYSSFNGLYFNGQKIIFFLDVEKLTSLWLKRIGGCQND